MQLDRCLRRIAVLGVAGVATPVMCVSALGFGAGAAYADNGVQPVTFSVGAGSLTIAQTPSAPIALTANSATAMPVTTVTDGRNDVLRTGGWSVSNVASDLTESGGGVITANNIAVAQSGSFTTGTGSADATMGGTVSATGDSINSVYTYTPTAELTVPTGPSAGSYSGTVTQTVV
jgi:hypothetical protein